jgi:hypothetical protein
VSRVLSLNARRAHDAGSSDVVEVMLAHITHPDLEAPVRLSTDPTERISLDPLTYGTRSTWLTEDGSPFLFVLMSAVIPDDNPDAPQTAALVLDMLDSDTAAPFWTTLTGATVDLAVVYSSTPDVIEVEFLGLELTSFEFGDGQGSLSLTRPPLATEPFPARRMTRAAFPGLHR